MVPERPPLCSRSGNTQKAAPIMSLKARLEVDKVTAMRAATGMGPEAVEATMRLSVIRAALTAISKAETAGKERIELDDTAVFAVLRKEVKQRHDAASMYADAGETARAEKETAEAAMVAVYLPQMLDEDATRTLVAGVIAETGASGPQGIGVVMKAIGARADIDKALVSRIARDLL